MDYREESLKFLQRSRAELLRLEEEAEKVAEIVAGLEALLSGSPSPAPMNEEKSPAPPRIPPVPTPAAPAPPPPVFPGAGRTLRPVGEVALALLSEGPEEGMSLEVLYQLMKERADLAPSSDLRNAIRVSLIRRRPTVVSPRRGWFRLVREA